MLKLKYILKTVKHFSLKEKQEKVKDWFTRDRMQLNYNSIKDHSLHAGQLLHILLNYGCSHKNMFMVRNQFREDLEIDSLSHFGWFHKSAENLTKDYEKSYHRSISQSQIQRILDTFFKMGLIRRKKAGKNSKDIPNQTYLYRINYKKICELFCLDLPSYQDLIKVKKSGKKNTLISTSSKGETITPVFNKLNKSETTFQIKRKNSSKSEYKQPILLSCWKAVLTSWQSIASEIGVKERDLSSVGHQFELHWGETPWRKSISPDGLKRLWRGWCYNWVNLYAEKLGMKPKKYKDLEGCYRLLNPESDNQKDSFPFQSFSLAENSPPFQSISNEERSKVGSLMEEFLKEMQEKFSTKSGDK